MACSPTVSTPSPRVSRPSCWAMLRIAETMRCCSGSVSTFITNERSILIRPTAKRRILAIDACPVPKSSRSIAQPSLARSAMLRVMISSSVLATTVSRISTANRPGARSKRSNSQRILSTSCGFRNSSLEKFTPTMGTEKPFFSHIFSDESA